MRSSNANARTIGEKIDLQSQELRDRAAIVCSGYRPLTYGELESLIGQVRADLRSAGFGPRARIAVAVPSGVHAALSLVAVMASAVAVPLNSNSTAHEVEVFADTLRPDAILLLVGSNIAARRVAEQKGICIIEAIPAKDRRLGLKILAPRADNEAPFENPQPEAPAFILHTSGSTADPKLIPFSHQNMLAAAERVSGWFDLTPQDRCLCVTPIYYSHGLKVTVLTPLLTGGSIAFPADPSAFDYAEWFGALEPTWYSAGPTLHTFIFDHAKSVIDAEAKHSLRFILSGGAPLRPEIQKGLQRTLGVPVVEHYGSSEAAQISANLPPPGASKPGSCGIPPPGTVMIVDENGRQVPPGREGEILVGGPTLMAGYLDAPELNRASFVDGWLKTGDIGSFDDDGFLTLHGRQKDLISRGAEKIWPVEIESVLMQHPAIAEAAAFAVPHPRLGEDVFAAVVLRHGMAARELELRTFLSQQLSAFKVPRQIKIVDKLPKGLAGKLLRRRLSEAFAPNTMPNFDLITSPNENTLTLELTDIWKRLLNTASIGLDDDFFDSGGDSLLATELLSEIEKLTGQVVPASALFETATIRQLAKRISELNSAPYGPLRNLHPTGKQAPLFYFHGDPGGGSYVNKLAKALGPNQPIFVIDPHGTRNEPIPDTIEEMAANRLPLMKDAQPEGPYRLCGYCMGGLVALEVARLLVQAGQKVELVLIDAPVVNARRSVRIVLSALNRRTFRDDFFDQALVRLWRYLSRFEQSFNDPTQIVKIARDHILAVGSRMFVRRQRAVSKAPDLNAETARLAAGRHAYFRRYQIAMSRYVPKSLPVKVTFFSAEYDGAALRQLGCDVDVIRLSGDHYQILKDPAEIAAYLRTSLRKEDRFSRGWRTG